MSYAKRGTGLLMVCLGIGLVGCAPKMTKEDMKAMMPQRPAQLDQLNMFVGTWEGDATMTMAGMDEPCKSHGRSTFTWDCDNWMLVEKSEYAMLDMDPMKGMGTWTYDIKGKKFRSCWMDSSGMIGQGTSTYDPASRTWKLSFASRTPWGNTTGKGKMVFTDDDTMNWEWKEYSFFGLIKIMEGHGTNRRM